MWYRNWAKTFIMIGKVAEHTMTVLKWFDKQLWPEHSRQYVQIIK